MKADFMPDWDNNITMYRGFVIHQSSYSPFGRDSAYSWTHNDYDGDGDNRTGFGRDVKDCVTAIDVWYVDNEETE